MLHAGQNAVMRSQFRFHPALLTGLVLAGLFLLPMLRVGQSSVPVFWDDISIVFVYAHNLLQGGGFFYNTPADRVDGFTSLMDVLLMLPFAAFDYAHMYQWNYYLKAALTSAVPVVLWLLLRQHGSSMLTATLVAATLAVSEVLAHGFAMQVEGPVYALLLLAFFGVLLSQTPARALWLAATGFLLCLTRPEAMLLVPASIVGFVVLLRGDPRVRQTLQAGVLFTIALATWLAWRVAYFGFWAPNSYYAKMSGSRLDEIRDGLNFVSGYFLRSTDAFLYLVPIVLLIPFGLRYMASRNDRQAATVVLLTGITILMLGVRIATGGDSYWILSRLMMDSAIPAALAVGIGLTYCRSWRIQLPVAATVILAISGNVWIIAKSLPQNIGGFIRLEQRASANKDCERAALSQVRLRYPDGRFAHTDFQRAKYYEPALEVIDLTGLNHRDIAHSTDGNANPFGKHNLQTALDEGVELWHLGTGPIRAYPLTDAYWRAALTADEDRNSLLRGPLPFLQTNAMYFLENYEPLATPAACGGYLNLLVRK